MVNVFVESYDLTLDYLRPALSEFIGPESRVAVVPLSFRDSQASSASDWDALYGRESGRYYAGIAAPLMAYGVAEENIRLINYFSDSHEAAQEIVRNADVVYLTGGMMDQYLERIDEFGLQDVLQAHKGVIIGYSAGALIQLAEFHVSPDNDYPEFGYYEGLSLLKDFYLEVHYQGNPVQQACIRRVLQERGKPVCAMVEEKGAILIADSGVQLLGDVRWYETGAEA